jgi:hypothetical protein
MEFPVAPLVDADAPLAVLVGAIVIFSKRSPMRAGWLLLLALPLAGCAARPHSVPVRASAPAAALACVAGELQGRGYRVDLAGRDSGLVPAYRVYSRNAPGDETTLNLTFAVRAGAEGPRLDVRQVSTLRPGRLQPERGAAEAANRDALAVEASCRGG